MVSKGLLKMEVFNQETTNKKANKIVIIFDCTEVDKLMEALRIAIEKRRRKKSFKNILKQLEEKAAIY